MSCVVGMECGTQCGESLLEALDGGDRGLVSRRGIGQERFDRLVEAAWRHRVGLLAGARRDETIDEQFTFERPGDVVDPGRTVDLGGLRRRPRSPVRSRHERCGPP